MNVHTLNVPHQGGLLSSDLGSLRRRVRTIRRGASLMEVSFVLLVMVGIIAGALAMASSVMSQNTITQEVQTISNLSGAVQRTKTTSGYGSASDIKVALDQMKLVPTNVSRTGSGSSMVLRNGWGGVIDFQVVNGGADFTLSYSNVPESECAQLVNSVKPGILRSVGEGTATTNNMHALTPTVISGDICKAAQNTLIWGSALL